jgi:hypothetical protein
MAGTETIHDWFVRCINKFMPSQADLERWRITENLAIFALVEWSHPGRQLQTCSINVLKSEASLEDYYLDKIVEAYYLRLDYDYGTLGPMFTHPLPHVHAWPSDSAPRFVAEGPGDNVVVDFLEWLYRHFYHQQWLNWAERVCQPEFAKRYSEEKNPLYRIFRAFKDSQITVLRDFPDDIQLIKELVNERKSRAYDLRVSIADRELLQYP